MSATKINLEYPYNADWKYGYLVTNSEGRRTVVLYNSHNDRSSTQYARYLLAVSLGRYLTSEEEADHRDNDKTNDDINNLKVMTSENNRHKEINRRLNNQVAYTFNCENCGNPTTFTQREMDHKVRQNVSGIFCSRLCGIKYRSINGDSVVGKSVSDEIKNKIRKLREDGGSSYSISKELNISRNTVMKYW